MQFFIHSHRDSEDENLKLDYNPTTKVATIKTTVDAHFEAQWRASGVRILRSDVPFVGPRLTYRGLDLDPDRTLVENEICDGSHIQCVWPNTPVKEIRRMRYGPSADRKVQRNAQSNLTYQRKKRKREGRKRGKKIEAEKIKAHRNEGAQKDDEEESVAHPQVQTYHDERPEDELEERPALQDDVRTFLNETEAEIGALENASSVHVYESDGLSDAAHDRLDIGVMELFDFPGENKENEDPDFFLE